MVFVSVEKYTCVFPSLQTIVTGQVKLCLADPGVIFVQLPFLSGFEVELQGRWQLPSRLHPACGGGAGRSLPGGPSWCLQNCFWIWSPAAQKQPLGNHRTPSSVLSVWDWKREGFCRLLVSRVRKVGIQASAAKSQLRPTQLSKFMEHLWPKTNQSC